MRTRFLTACVAISLGGFASPSFAGNPEPEVILHIEATAQVDPDRFTVSLPLYGRGKTKARAEAELARQEAELMAHLKALGINPASVRREALGEDPKLDAAAEEAAACAALDAAAAAEEASGEAPAMPAAKRGRNSLEDYCADMPEKEQIVGKTYVITLGDAAQADALVEAFLDDSLSSARRRVQYGQADPVAARDKARSLAIAKARADADAYAAALGYRVVRIQRVSNARPGISMNELIGFFVLVDDRTNRKQPGWFAATVSESVAIDFVMVPK